MFFFFFFFFFVCLFWSYEINVYCFSSCLTWIVFSPYTTEVHREYVPVAGHGAWLAVLFSAARDMISPFVQQKVYDWPDFS